MGKIVRTCPARPCPPKVPATLFACRTHWNALSREARKAIWDTVGLPTLHPDRRAAIEKAMAEWKQQRDQPNRRPVPVDNWTGMTKLVSSKQQQEA